MTDNLYNIVKKHLNFSLFVCGQIFPLRNSVHICMPMLFFCFFPEQLQLLPKVIQMHLHRYPS